MLLSKLLAICFSLIIGVEASGRDFLPTLQAPKPGPSLRSNATRALDRRFVSFEPGNSGGTTLWPDRTITYAFDEVKYSLVGMMIMTRAHALWTSNGLPETFKLKPESKTKCYDHRTSCLLVKFVEDKNYETHIAIPLRNSKNDATYEGPVMQLLTEEAEKRRSSNSDPSSDKYAVIVAHELGHAWGLLHEHQSPVYWPRAGYHEDSRWNSFAFTGRNFKCDNIPGYETALEQAREEIQKTDSRYKGKVPEDICKSWSLAKAVKFPASDFLPGRTTIWSDRSDKSAAGPGDVDWDSIMLYSTYILGSKGVLYDSDVNVIKERVRPSPRDIAGLIALYDAGYKREKAKLHNEPDSNSLDDFLKISCG